MENILNIIHFFVHKTLCKIEIVFNKVIVSNIVNIIETPMIKNRFKKQGIEVKKEMDKVLDKDHYYCIGRSGGFMGMLTTMIFWGIVNYYYGLLRKEPALTFFHFIAFIAFSFIINQYFLFRNNIYKKYFRKFEKFEKRKKEKWAWYSFVIVIGVIIFSIGGFIFLNFRI